MLYDGKFDTLDAEVNTLLRSKSRFQGGDWKLYRFFGAVGRPFGGYGDLSDRSASPDVPFATDVRPPLSGSDIEAAWQRHLTVLRGWRSSRPKSQAAVIAFAEALTGYGWHARGGGYADTVTPDRARLFHERLSEAEHVLSEHRLTASRNPQFFCLMIDLAKGQGRERHELDALVKDAMALEPLYLHVYGAAARYLTPRWMGAPGDWERFASGISERIGGREGSIIYGHIAWQLAAMYGVRAFFSENDVSWPRIKQAFVDREAAYGSSPELLNAFALLAGFTGDQKVAREIFVKLGDEWDVTLWRERRYFDAYRKRAGVD
jgi:hypothetical protein